MPQLPMAQRLHQLMARLHVTVAAARRDDRGASLVEYVFLTALIAVVCIAAVTFLGTEASDSLDSSGSSIFEP